MKSSNAQITETNRGGQTLTFSASLGKYQYVKTLGKGSFSIVALVFEKQTKVFYACKIVSRQQLIEQNIFTRFEQEVRIQQTLHHPNIVQIYDIIYEKDIIAVIIEYCKNGELFNFIAMSGFLVDLTIQVMFRKIVLALEYIHSKGIAHRDIKPENILLDEHFNPKLADFGLCHLMPKSVLLSTPCGSPFYAPPEIISGLQYDGTKSDIWSLGIVLYSMATGELPWTALSQQALFHQIQNVEFTIPPGISPPIQQLLHAMLSKDPTKRPSASEIKQIPWLEEDLQIQTTPLKKSSSRSRSIASCDDAVYQLRKTFTDPSRKVIVRPKLPNARQARHSMNLNNYSPINDIIIRKVPPRTIPKPPS